MPSFEDAVTHLVRRHLGAFGPASVDDIASWTAARTPPIRAAIEALGKEIATFTDERGRTLYDLTRAPRPAADTAAPVRFLAKWDSPLLAYTTVDRIRILPEAYRKDVIIKNGDVAQTFLVDGMVAGTWETRIVRKQAVLELKAFTKIAKSAKAALIEEGEHLARFIEPEAPSHAVVV